MKRSSGAVPPGSLCFSMIPSEGPILLGISEVVVGCSMGFKYFHCLLLSFQVVIEFSVNFQESPQSSLNFDEFSKVSAPALARLRYFLMSLFADPWIRPMDLIHGSYPWIMSMAEIHG